MFRHRCFMIVLSLPALAWGALVVGAEPTKPAEPAKSTAQQPADDRRVEQLIQQLGDDDFFVRQRAQQDLAQLGIEAFDDLSEAENNPDLEIADRARYLIRMMRVEWTQPSDPAEVKQLLEDYDASDEPARLTKIIHLGELVDGEGVAALCRLVRFEKSPLLSKRAALAVIQQKPSTGKLSPKLDEAVRHNIGRSTRAGAQWLRTYLTARSEGAKPGQWAKLAEAETGTLRQFPQQSRPDIVIGLWKQEVDVLKQAGRDDDALAAVERTVNIEPDTTEGLNDLITWLVEQKAWNAVDEAAKRYADRFEQEPMLLYTLAEACEARGNKKLAQETAERALKLNHDNQRLHLIVAYKLQLRGEFDWAQREYREVIRIGPAGQGDTVRAQGYMAEMLHDLGKDGEAAEALKESTAAIEARMNAGNGLADLDSDLPTTRARMRYFQACDAAAHGDRAKQIEFLEKGLEEDATDADVLIALYRMPDLEKSLRERTMKLIADATRKFRAQIEQDQDNATYYNQLAWLVANTEGDREEALRCSQRSLEIRPSTSGYLDTLGHCYYALKDYANAVKYQGQAVQLDPHSKQLNRQLAHFRQKLAESEKQAKQPKPDKK
jgi:tetratricopeptide (TPR) repeat protein